MQVKRNPDNQDYSKFFTDFKTQSKKWKLDVKKNIRTEQEFLTWLLSKKSELSIK
jgi:predicted transcriptional regulator